jgi:hypothetical protein
MNLKPITVSLLFIAIAGSWFATWAHAETSKVEPAPQPRPSERPEIAPPIRVILPALWEQKAPASRPATTSADGPPR